MAIRKAAKMRRAAVLVAIVSTAGLALGGCGGSGTKTVTVGQTPTTQTTQTTLTDDAFCQNGRDTQNGAPCTPQTTDTTTQSTTTTTQTTSTDSTTTTPPDFCDTHTCIGDWQKEADEGGYVVQCNDGAWSHAGGLRGACSWHGGESSSTDTTGNPNNPPTTTTTSTYQPPPPPSYRFCDQNVQANENTSCPLAENVFVAYFDSGGPDWQNENVTAHSSTTGQDYPFGCTTNQTRVRCDGQGADGALKVTFPMWAVKVYHH